MSSIRGSTEETKDEDLSNNPFVALFPSVKDAQAYIEATRSAFKESDLHKFNSSNNGSSGSSKPTSDLLQNLAAAKSEKDEDEISQRHKIVNDMLQRIFLISVDPDSQQTGLRQYGSLPHRCIFLRDLHQELKDGNDNLFLTVDNLNQALMERLSMSQPRTELMFTSGVKSASLTTELEAEDHQTLKFLANCFKRIFEEENNLRRKIRHRSMQDDVDVVAKHCRSLVFSYAGSVLLSPEIFPTPDPYQQLFTLFLSSQDMHHLPEFLEGLVNSHSDMDDLRQIFIPVLNNLQDRVRRLKLMDPDVFTILEVLTFFAKHPKLAQLLVTCEHWLPPKLNQSATASVKGIEFENATILGGILKLTTISYDPRIPSEYFLEPSNQTQREMELLTHNVRQQIDLVCQKLHEVLLSVLENPELQHRVLYWIGVCLHKNKLRGQMSYEMDLERAMAQSKDGFFLNLSHVLLKLCEPFLTPGTRSLLRVDPRYGISVTSLEQIAQPETKVHLVGLHEESPMVPKPDDAEPVSAEGINFKFVTECFFLTHECFKVGFSKACDTYHSLMKSLQQLSDVYRDARAQGNIESEIEPIRNRFERGIQQQLSYKAHLLDPTLTDLVFRFSIATCYWLVQQVLAENNIGDATHREVTEDREMADAIECKIPDAMTVIPEFVVENVANCLIFISHFSEETLEKSEDLLQHIMMFFTVLLGSPQRLKNPHLRAKLAEAFAAFLPREKSQEFGFTASFNPRNKVFDKNPMIAKFLPEALLKLFVDIEFTGHSMEFEQKFGYRHHMYNVLEYLWKNKSFHETFLNLYDEGCRYYKACSDFSTFPRFINLLVNDATFLVDEALQHLVKIRELEKEKKDGGWDTLLPGARQEKERNLDQYEKFARGYNIMASETVHTLCYITSDIPRPFASRCMADGMAAFLNYSLLLLVGPKSSDLKVQDLDKYHFKPGELVGSIVQIYLNLGTDEDSFCRSVAKDSRSYSTDLFRQAENVLWKIGKPNKMMEDLKKLAVKFEKFADELRVEEANMPEPPEEFVDPILGTVMYEPVRLPSSGKILDKPTIARHLLSDPKDPFNRSPLTLDMVEPQVELQEIIHQWMDDNNIRRPSKDCNR